MGLRKGVGVQKVSGEVVEYESGKGRKSCVCNWQKHNYKMRPFNECLPLVLTESNDVQV